MEYTTINNQNEAVEHINIISKKSFNSTPYRTVISKSGSYITTNVPQQIYDHHELKEYFPPKKENKFNNNQYIGYLQASFDFFHHNFPDMHEKYEDGKVFHYNQCYDNSSAVYHILINLSQNNDLPVVAPICICIGYISRIVEPGALIGNAVVNFEGLIVHDWHVWNKINNFIIDLSILKSEGFFAPETKQIKWDNATDHVFKHSPKYTKYSGIDFDNYLNFVNFATTLFNNEKQNN